MVRRINPLVYEPMSRNYGRAKAKGESHFKKYLRSCGHNFVSRPEVREFVFARDNHECVECGNSNQLEVDHKVSIYRVFKDGIDIREVNHLDNLQTLCKRCNSGKKP